MWSLPETEPEQDIAAACMLRWGVRVKQQMHITGFRHSFSHYHLDILPCKLLVEVGSDVVRDNDQSQWVKLSQQAMPAVAAPVARLLSEYAASD